MVNEFKIDKTRIRFSESEQTKKQKSKNVEVAFYEARPGANKDRFLLSTSLDRFGKIIEDFKPNNYSTLSAADRRKGIRSKDDFVGSQIKACQIFLTRQFLPLGLDIDKWFSISCSSRSFSEKFYNFPRDKITRNTTQKPVCQYLVPLKPSQSSKPCGRN